MNILLKMFVTSMLMIIGLGLFFSGIMLWSIGREADQSLVVALLTIGIIFGPGGLYFIIKMNRSFQEAELKKVLNQPERILLRFPRADGKGEIIIANDALFDGIKHYPFKTTYEHLEGLRKEGNTLFFDMNVTVGTKNFSRTRKIEIPVQYQYDAEIVYDKLKKMWIQNN